MEKPHKSIQQVVFLYLLNWENTKLSLYFLSVLIHASAQHIKIIKYNLYKLIQLPLIV